MGKTIVVSGAAGGIGEAVVLKCVRRGDRVIGIDRDSDGLARLAQSLTGGGFFPVEADIATPGSDESVVGQIKDAGFGGLDALVHCAGVGGWKPFAEMTVSDWDTMLNTNARGVLMLTHALLPWLRHQTATLVHISSDAALSPFANRTSYCASKAALVAAFDVIREELRPAGVRVSTVYCNRVDTKFNGRLAGSRPEALRPEDIAASVDALLDLRPGVEIREIHIAAQRSPFGG